VKNTRLCGFRDSQTFNLSDSLDESAQDSDSSMSLEVKIDSNPSRGFRRRGFLPDVSFHAAPNSGSSRFHTNDIAMVDSGTRISGYHGEFPSSFSFDSAPR
jgi:hypothetical protein